MSSSSKLAYIATDNPVDLFPLLMSLQEQGYHFNGPESMASWFLMQDIPFQTLSMGSIIEGLLQDQGESLKETIFILHGAPYLHEKDIAMRDLLVSALTLIKPEDVLLLTDAQQYAFLKPEILSNPEHRQFVAGQLYNDIYPGAVLLFQQAQFNGDRSRMLYSYNPAWANALEILKTPSASGLSEKEFKNILAGSHLMMQLARTADIHPYQAILVRHGAPVQVACHSESIEKAMHDVIFRDSMLIPGATLVVSQPLSVEMARMVSQSGIKAVVSSNWNDAALSALEHTVIAVDFHLDQLKIPSARISVLGRDTVLFESIAIDARQVQWQTQSKPTDKQFLDLEIGVVLAENLVASSAVLIKNQQSIAVVQGFPLALQAVEHMLNIAPGETEGAVCVIQGYPESDILFNALIQARVAGVLFVDNEPLPKAMVESLKSLPFFMGAFGELPVAQSLQRMEVRHG